jgi:GNAT superfamily N-acetyltransferase
LASQGSSDRGGEHGPSTPNGSLHIERLTHAEIPEICNLLKRVADACEPPLVGEVAKAWKPTPLEFTSWMERVTYFVAMRDGKMVGAIGCEITDGNCRLMHIAVVPEFRRKKVASALVQQAIDWAKHSNANEIWVDVLARFSTAPTFLKNMEFKEAGTLHRHRHNEDVRFFEKTL